MSDIVEKTLTALPGLFLQNQSTGGPGAAKASFSSRRLVRGITALTSKHVGARRAGREIIRRKAVLALYKFHLIAPNQVQHIHIKFRKALCDRDVGVMAASLHIYLKMIKTMNAVFSVGGDVMHPDIPNNFLRLLAEGFDDETENQQLRLYAVQSYLTLLDVENVFYPQRFLQVMSWHAFELKHLNENVEFMKSLLPVDKSCEDMVVDSSLSFLDGFVAEELSQGAAPYKPHHQRQEEKLSQEKVLNFEPYGLSFSSSGFTGRQSPAGISLGSDVSGNSTETGLKETNSLKLEGIKKLWGKEGYLPKKGSKTGDETEAPPVPQETMIMENVDQTMTKKDQSQVPTQSKEEKEKQLLASSLFVGLGSESTVNLGKAGRIGTGYSPSVS
ncbi:hypothetical protein CB1_000540011 [Camelus ferus]|nr:hypothetical protein CB1_000540011 [Camelus ferus]